MTATVDVSTYNDPVARPEQFEDGSYGGHAGGKGEGCRSGFERSHCALEGSAGRILGARVIEASRLPNTWMGKGGGLVDRR
jgi:hypothetical protein